MKSDYTAYDYKEVTVEKNKLSFYLDCYENFGWILDERFSLVKAGDMVTLHLKRNRKMINKTELTRLQRHFESCVSELIKLEKSKSTTAITACLVIGVIGTAFMAGSVFAITADPPKLWLSIILAIPAFIGWLIPPLFYNNILLSKSKKLEPYIEKKYDEIYEICQKGHHLL